MPVTSCLHGDECVRGPTIVAALPSDNQDNMIKSLPAELKQRTSTSGRDKTSTPSSCCTNRIIVIDPPEQPCFDVRMFEADTGGVRDWFSRLGNTWRV